MSERPKDDDRSAKMVPGPWRWGWWRQHSDSGELEFCPLSDLKEINPISGIFKCCWNRDTANLQSIELSHREYGDRVRNPREMHWTFKDGKLDEPLNVLSWMKAQDKSTGEPIVSILATKPVRALIAAAPELLAACEAIDAGPIDEPQIDLSGEYETGLFCGLEDRCGQDDAYGACRYGFDEGVERALEWAKGVISEAIAKARGGDDG